MLPLIIVEVKINANISKALFGLIEHNETKRNKAEWNKNYIPPFGYFMTERNKLCIPLFGKWIEWNKLYHFYSIITLI